MRVRIPLRAPFIMIRQYYKRYDVTCPKCGAVAELQQYGEEGISWIVYYKCTECETKYRQALTPTGALTEMKLLELFKDV